MGVTLARAHGNRDRSDERSVANYRADSISVGNLAVAGNRRHCGNHDLRQRCADGNDRRANQQLRQVEAPRQRRCAVDEPVAEEEELIPLSKTLILLVAGAAVIAVGANLLVDNGTLIAQALGVPESVIALTFVALGTSLPELVTAITSLIKGHSDLSVGNVVGANVFNLVLVSGVSVTLAPFTIPQSSTLFGVNSSLVLDLPVMLAVMLIMTVPALVKGKMNRAQGIILLAIYAAFCAIQFTM